MSDKTKIEWTRGDDGSPGATWNPVTGCSKVSAGCEHCYAETLAERFRGTPGHYFEHGFDVQLRPEKLEQPLRWRRPRRIFVNSMSDVFHDQVPDEYVAKVFAIMALAPQHTFQVLTKRHARMRSLLSRPEFWHLVTEQGRAHHISDGQGWLRVGAMLGGRPLPNVWLGCRSKIRSGPTSASRPYSLHRRPSGFCPVSRCSARSTSPSVCGPWTRMRAVIRGAVLRIRRWCREETGLIG